MVIIRKGVSTKVSDRPGCKCSECQAFCRAMPGMLVYNDLERIRLHLGITREDLNRNLRASPGALVAKATGEIDEREMMLRDLIRGTIR